MYATTHVLASIVISQHTPNPWWAFFVSLLSHYVLDFIPHGDRPVERWIKRGPHLARSLTVLMIDIALMAIIFGTLYFQLQLPAPSIVIAAIIGGLLPDILWIAYDMYKRHIIKHRFFFMFFKRWHTKYVFGFLDLLLDHHSRIHSYIDSRINKHSFPAVIGALIQAAFAGAFILLALYFW